MARQRAVVCGLEIVQRIFCLLDKSVRVSCVVGDGVRVKPGQVLLRISGRARGILTGERVALNFLGRLSGIATVTRSFTDAVRGTKAVILDTRKTTPGLRHLERYAVRVGGGQNHRFDLGEMVLVKDNHRALSASADGGLAGMVRGLHHKTKKPVEVEVDTLKELEDVLRDPPGFVLLDNMSAVDLRKAVKMTALLPRARRPLLEASGGINLENVRAVAQTGVDRISIGALTHSAPCVDVSLELRTVLNA